VNNLVGEISTQFDIDAAAGHVGGDRHGSRQAGTGYDACLPRMFLGI
jgi:hypothetical protein